MRNKKRECERGKEERGEMDGVEEERGKGRKKRIEREKQREGKAYKLRLKFSLYSFLTLNDLI